MLETLASILDFWFWLLVPSVLAIGLLAALPTAMLLAFVVKEATRKAKREPVQPS